MNPPHTGSFPLAPTLAPALAFVLALVIALAAPPHAAAQGLTVTQGGGAPLDVGSLSPLYREPFDDTTPPEALLGGILTFGPDGSWSGAHAGGRYQLTNAGEPGAVRYYYLTDVSGVSGPLSAGAVSVQVEARSDAFHAIGLVYRFEPDSGSYYAFVLTGGDGYAVYRRDADGLRELLSGGSDAVRPEGANQLTIASQGAETRLYVNGGFVASIGDPNAPHGGIGLFAAGTGSFAFDDLTVYAATSAAAPTTPTAGGGYLGTFSDGAVTLTLRVAPDGQGLAGQLATGDDAYPVAASGAFESIEGVFEADGQSWPFIASLDGDILSLVTGGATYTLARVAN